MTGLSLFSGVGGLDLAFEWAGGTVAAMCEINPFCRKVLRKHWPDVPLFGDVKEVKGADVGTIDVVYGGFPCQPFSLAGDRKGRDDTRYLWPEFARLVGEIGPRWVVAENVPGILTLAADDVCQDLERLGYEVGIWNFEALSVGAPHRRARIFFVAHLTDPNRQRCEVQRNGVPAEQKLCGTECRGGGQPESRVGGGFDGIPPWMDGYWEDGSPRTARGIPDRVARLKTLGNAVVPQQAYPIFRAIAEVERETVA